MGRKRRRRCEQCGELYFPHPRTVRRQRTCPEAMCKRDQKNAWQRKRRAEDADYRANDTRCNQAWAARNPDYWKDRRRQAKSSVRGKKRNRQQPSERNDWMAMVLSLKAGSYRLELTPTDERNAPASRRDEKRWGTRCRARLKERRRELLVEDEISVESVGGSRIRPK